MSQPTNLRGLIGDTSFWIEAFDPTGEHHAAAVALLEDLRKHVILMPWPIMYEVLRTRTVRNRRMVQAFERVLRQPKVLPIDDAPYRSGCLEATIREASTGRRAISLVDMVVREVLSDRKYRVARLLTFNPSDFNDVCRIRGVDLWPHPS